MLIQRASPKEIEELECHPKLLGFARSEMRMHLAASGRGGVVVRSNFGSELLGGAVFFFEPEVIKVTGLLNVANSKKIYDLLKSGLLDVQRAQSSNFLWAEMPLDIGHRVTQDFGFLLMGYYELQAQAGPSCRVGLWRYV